MSFIILVSLFQKRCLWGWHKLQIHHVVWKFLTECHQTLLWCCILLLTSYQFLLQKWTPGKYGNGFSHLPGSSWQNIYNNRMVQDTNSSLPLILIVIYLLFLVGLIHCNVHLWNLAMHNFSMCTFLGVPSSPVFKKVNAMVPSGRMGLVHTWMLPLLKWKLQKNNVKILLEVTEINQLIPVGNCDC